MTAAENPCRFILLPMVAPKRYNCAVDRPVLDGWLAGASAAHPLHSFVDVPEYLDDVGDMAAVGDESAIAARLARYADAGATDIAVRVVPWGKTRDERIASRDRTEALVASL